MTEPQPMSAASPEPPAEYPDYTQPYNVLHCYPEPMVAYTLILLPWQAHSPYAAWDSVLEWPNGYQRLMVYNLACEIAPQYGIEPSATVLRIAEESKRALYPLNMEMGYLSLNPRRRVGVSGHGYNRDFLAGR